MSTWITKALNPWQNNSQVGSVNGSHTNLIAPHAFRKEASWQERLLMWSISAGCQHNYTTVCDEGTLKVRIDDNCTMKPKFMKLNYGGLNVCAEEEYEGS